MTFIIAEACVNFRNLHEAALIIEGAAAAGADAVKFQFYRAEDVQAHDRYEQLRHIMMDGPSIEYLKEVCDFNKVEFMCTPSYRGAVLLLSPLVKRWKIRYGDRNNVELYSALREDSRPILVSCSGRNDTIFTRRARGKKNIITMFCVPEYPPKVTLMPRIFGDKWGFSSHYADPKVPLQAVKRGANFLEVHVKLDEYANDWIPTDDAVSLPMTGLQWLVREIREFDATKPAVTGGDPCQLT